MNCYFAKPCIAYQYSELSKRSFSKPECSYFAGIMNSLSGKSALALCRVFSSPLSLPPAIVGAVRVCHSGVNSKGTVFTKKRGYDITRNPDLNKVSNASLWFKLSALMVYVTKQLLDCQQSVL